MIQKIRDHLLSVSLSVLLVLVAVSFGSVYALSTPNTVASPTVTGFTSSNKTLGAAGGAITISAKVTNAKECTFLVAPKIANFNKAVICQSGRVPRGITIPENTGKTNIIYTFSLDVTGKNKVVRVSPIKVTEYPLSINIVLDSLVASPKSFSSVGGTTTLIATVRDARKCTFSVRPTISKFDRTIACSHNRVTYSAHLPKNTTKTKVVYTFYLTVTGKRGVVQAVPVKVSVNPLLPTIDSFVASPRSLPTSGGTVSLSGRVSNETRCSIFVSPSVTGFGGPLTCTVGTFNQSLSLPVNSTSNIIDYTFMLRVFGKNGYVTSSLIVSVEGTGTSSGINIISGLSGPILTVSDGSHLWVGNYTNNSLTEINQANGKIIRTILSPRYGFKEMGALAYDGTNIWVVNTGNNSITQINASTGALKRFINSPSYGFRGPAALAYDGTNIWVVNSGNKSITQINASTGKLYKISKYPNQLNVPDSIAYVNKHMWVANYQSNTITEINAATDSVVRIISSPYDDLDGPSSIKYYSNHLWIANHGGNNTVTELNASNGSLVRVINGPSYKFDGPFDITSDGAHIWITNAGYYNGATKKFAGGNSVSELNASNGSLVRVINGPSYKFDGPTSITYASSHLWVTNYNMGTITEFTP
ncbi:MAG TPA: hypothetical protein VMR76_03030 [Candidatus Saccharimonadia bacterium]|nr:hypothetical protein [Candidatus Saccharimonadia bacterium]